MITIVRVYDKQKPNTHREYCGRPGKGQLGLLGNPFAANVTHSNRDEVCDKYHEYFHSNIPQRAKELIEIAKTQDIELACFCAPKRCHTETIKAYIEQQLEEFKIKAENERKDALNDYVLSTFDDSWADDDYEPVMTYVNGEQVDARTLTM